MESPRFDLGKVEKEKVSFDFAITGLEGNNVSERYGDNYLHEVESARSLILELLAKSVEAREQAAHVSRKYFGTDAADLISVFQQRLALADKKPKKTRRTVPKMKKVDSVLDSLVVEQVKDMKDTKADPKSDPKSETKETKETKDAKADPKADPKADSKADPKETKEKADTKADPKADPKADTKSAKETKDTKSSGKKRKQPESDTESMKV